LQLSMQCGQLCLVSCLLGLQGVLQLVQDCLLGIQF
jgi:hypothetical protein